MGNYIKRNKFDFEIGYLTKSPCTKCANRSDLPKCHKGCNILDRIQTTIAQGIQTQSRSYGT